MLFALRIGIGRGWLVAGTLLAGRVVVACCDECVPDTFLQLGTPSPEVEESVRLEFSTAKGKNPKVTCTWAPSEDEWSCEPPPRSRDERGLRYELGTRGPWLVHASGPSGEADFRADVTSTDPMEAWPGSCPGYPDELTIRQSDLEKVGAVIIRPPETTFGTACASDAECETWLHCGQSPTTGLYHCTRSCQDSVECPADSFCNGECDWFAE